MPLQGEKKEKLKSNQNALQEITNCQKNDQENNDDKIDEDKEKEEIEEEDDDFNEEYTKQDGKVLQSDCTALVPHSVEVSMNASKSTSLTTITTGTLMEEETNNDMEYRIAQFVQESLFPWVKFISSKHQIAEKGKLYNYVLKKMNVPHSEKDKWWKSNSIMLQCKLNQRRNNVMDNIKKQFTGACDDDKTEDLLQ
jgi:hypothetical protein